MPSEIAPGLMVAMPSLTDPSFSRSVVLLVEHSDKGSLGFVINQPSRLRFAEVADSLSLRHVVLPSEPEAGIPVLTGGPVAPESGWILFDPVGVDQADIDDAIVLRDGLAVSASRRLLERIAGGEAPRRSVLALGYAGWDEGQLESELRQGSWLPVDLDARFVFDDGRDEIWRRVLRGAGIDPARLSSPGGGVAS